MLVSSLPRLAARAGDELEGAPPQEILRWAFDRFHHRLVIASSMGDAVLIDMASKISPGVPVVFVDTGYHFAETLGTRDAVQATYPVELVTARPKQTVAQQDIFFGWRLHDRDPDMCCRLRKVEPFERALSGYDAWASGIRRDETSSRREVRVIEWDAKREMVKVNPLAAWTQDDIDAYIADNGTLTNPLLNDGYPSIGCGPCTRRVAPGEDARAGRWSGTAKVECGLHA